MKIQGCLQIIFDGTFYKAIFESQDGNNYSVAQINLGTSIPKLNIIFKLVNQKFEKLNFYQSDYNARLIQKKINPKRAQRLASKQMKNIRLSTKAQNCLKQQFVAKKATNKKQTAFERELAKTIKFNLKQTKRKEKHRGH